MTMIQGVLGPIDTEDLGFTLMRHSVSEIATARERGVRTIVDLTPIDLGRDIDIIREVAEKAEVQVIAATGFYWHEEPWFVGWEADRLVDLLLRDLTVDIEGTDVKAGIIKCATDHPGVSEAQPSARPFPSGTSGTSATTCCRPCASRAWPRRRSWT